MYYVGIDGGGTKTETLICDHEGRLLGSSSTGGSNPHFVGTTAAFAAVADGLNGVMSQLDKSQIAQAALCVPGLRKHRQELPAVLGLNPSQLIVDSDLMSTFYGSLVQEHGVIVLAGTGSFSLGIAQNGNKVSAGGWGPVIGDAGSGQLMAVQALQATARQFDHMGPGTLLSDKIKDYFGMESINELKTIVNLDNVSKLTYIVRECAEEGDSIACEIIADAAKGLADLASAVIQQSAIDTDEGQIALAGGMWRLGDLLLRPFEEIMRERYSKIDIIPAKFPPVIGALLMALRADGIPWSEKLIQTMKKTMHK